MTFTTWRQLIEHEAQQDYFKQLWHKVEEARARGAVFPERQEIFSCFEACPLERVRVVIIGQDPYHGAGQAHGMSFSVKPGVKIPPSQNSNQKMTWELNRQRLVIYDHGQRRVCF